MGINNLYPATGNRWEKTRDTLQFSVDENEKLAAALRIFSPLSDSEIEFLCSEPGELTNALQRDVVLGALEGLSEDILVSLARSFIQVKKSMRFPKGEDPHESIIHDFQNRCALKLLELLPNSYKGNGLKEKIFRKFSIRDFLSFVASGENHSGYNPIIELLWSRRITDDMKQVSIERMADIMYRETGLASKYYPRVNEGRGKIKPQEHHEHASFWLIKIVRKYSESAEKPYPFKIFLHQIQDVMPILDRVEFSHTLRTTLQESLPKLLLYDDFLRPSLCEIIARLNAKSSLAVPLDKL